MNYKNINKELETLFQEWQERLGTNFTRDGVMYQNGKTEEQVEQEWIKSPKRVVFLLKDQHQYKKENEENWDEDIRYWLKEEDGEEDKHRRKKESNRNIEGKFLKNIAYILWGLVQDDNKDRNNGVAVKKHEEVKNVFNTQPFALVECKKEPGEAKLADKILCQHLNDYKEFLQREITILNPNIIVCCNNNIFEFMTNIYQDKEAIDFGGQYVLEDGTDMHFKTQLRYYPNDKIIVINSFHPSRRIANWKIVEKVLSPFRKFMDSEYASDFFK